MKPPSDSDHFTVFTVEWDGYLDNFVYKHQLDDSNLSFLAERLDLLTKLSKPAAIFNNESVIVQKNEFWDKELRMNKSK